MRLTREEMVQLVREAEREAAMRRRVYPGLIRRERMGEEQARAAIERMERIVDALRAAADNRLEVCGEEPEAGSGRLPM